MFATCGLMVQDLPATKRELRLRDSLKIFPSAGQLVRQDRGAVAPLADGAIPAGRSLRTNRRAPTDFFRDLNYSCSTMSDMSDKVSTRWRCASCGWRSVAAG